MESDNKRFFKYVGIMILCIAVLLLILSGESIINNYLPVIVQKVSAIKFAVSDMILLGVIILFVAGLIWAGRNFKNTPSKDFLRSMSRPKYDKYKKP